MPVHPGNFGVESILLRRVKQDRFTILQDLDMYLGAADAGVSMGSIAAGEAYGVAIGATAFNGSVGLTLSETNPLWIHARQSILFTGENLSSSGSNCTFLFTIAGYDLDGGFRTEQISLLTTNATLQAKSTIHIYSKLTSIILTSITGTAQANPLLAIGHGVATVATSAGICRFPMPKSIKSAGQISRLLDPAGLPVAINGAGNPLDFVRNCILNVSGTTLVAGEYVLHYNPAYIERL